MAVYICGENIQKDKIMIQTAGYGYPMEYGDRVFARVMQNGRSICELTLERVANFTEVVGEIRHILRKVKGLVRVVVRNFHKGWSVERPLMLYGEFPSPRRAGMRARVYTGGVETLGRMLMPWETH